MTHPAALLEAAIAHHRGGRLEQADGLYRRLLGQTEVGASAHCLLGLLEHQRGRPQSGAPLLRAAAALGPAAADCWHNLAIVAASLSRPLDAIAAARRAASLEPQVAGRWLGLARVTSDRRLIAKAGRRAFCLDPSSSEAADRLGRVSLTSGDLAAAVRHLTRVDALAGRVSSLKACLIRAVERPHHPPVPPVTFTDSSGHGIPVAPYVLRLAEGVVTGDFLVLGRGHELLLDGIVPDPSDPGRLAPNLVAHADDAAVLRRHHGRRLDRAVLLGGSGNYYHWLIDFLPRLSLLDPQAMREKIILNASPERFQVEALAVLGIGKEQLVELATDAELTVEALTVPSMMTRSSLVHPHAVAWLRERFRPTGTSRPRRIFVSRAGAQRRLLLDEEAVVAAIGPFGFDVIRAEAHSFAAQVELFASAEMVVSSHGAALANVVFAPPGCRVFEIDARGSHRSFFSVLSALVGAEYTRIIGEARDPFDLQFSSIRLGESGLRDLVHALANPRSPVAQHD